jgi:hypothetical protein
MRIAAYCIGSFVFAALNSFACAELPLEVIPPSVAQVSLGMSRLQVDTIQKDLGLIPHLGIGSPRDNGVVVSYYVGPSQVESPNVGPTVDFSEHQTVDWVIGSSVLVGTQELEKDADLESVYKTLGRPDMDSNTSHFGQKNEDIRLEVGPFSKLISMNYLWYEKYRLEVAYTPSAGSKVAYYLLHK